MGVTLRIDKPLFVLLEAVLNGILFVVLPNINLPMWAIAFLGILLNALVAYLMAESGGVSSSTATAPVNILIRKMSRVWNRIRYWHLPRFR